MFKVLITTHSRHPFEAPNWHIRGFQPVLVAKPYAHYRHCRVEVNGGVFDVGNEQIRYGWMIQQLLEQV